MHLGWRCLKPDYPGSPKSSQSCDSFKAENVLRWESELWWGEGDKGQRLSESACALLSSDPNSFGICLYSVCPSHIHRRPWLPFHPVSSPRLNFTLQQPDAQFLWTSLPKSNQFPVAYFNSIKVLGLTMCSALTHVLSQLSLLPLSLLKLLLCPRNSDCSGLGADQSQSICRLWLSLVLFIKCSPSFCDYFQSKPLPFKGGAS